MDFLPVCPPCPIRTQSSHQSGFRNAPRLCEPLCIVMAGASRIIPVARAFFGAWVARRSGQPG